MSLNIELQVVGLDKVRALSIMFTKFKSQGLYTIKIKYWNASGSGFPPSLIPALQKIGILHHKKAKLCKHMRQSVSTYFIKMHHCGKFLDFVLVFLDFLNEHLRTLKKSRFIIFKYLTDQVDVKKSNQFWKKNLSSIR